MRCLGRVEGCNDWDCQKPVDITEGEPKHVESEREKEKKKKKVMIK